MVATASWIDLVEDCARAAERRNEGSQYGVALRGTLRLFLGAYPEPLAVTARDVERWAYARGPKGTREPGPRTVANRLASVANFYRHLRRMGICSLNPTVDIPRPVAHPLIPRGLTEEQVRRIEAQFDASPLGRRHRAAFMLVVLSGLRLREAGCLRVRDLDRSRDGLTLFARFRAKRGKWRHRELPAAAVVALEAVYGAKLDELPADKLLLDMGPAGLYKSIRKAGKRAGIALTVHALRHTNAQLREDAGEDIRDIADALGLHLLLLALLGVHFRHPLA